MDVTDYIAFNELLCKCSNQNTLIVETEYGYANFIYIDFIFIFIKSNVKVGDSH